MGLPGRLYYSLDKAAKEINGDISDVLYYISVGLLDVALKVDLTELIQNDMVSIKGGFNKSALIKSRRARFRYRTNYARITEAIWENEKFRFFRQPYKVEGVFSIRLPAFLAIGNRINGCDKFNVDKLYPVRLPAFTYFDFNEYNPRVILIKGGLNITLNDLVITEDELKLLKLGGITINWRLNSKNSNTDKMPPEFKDRLQKLYASREQANTVLIGKPRNKYREIIVEIARATRTNYPWSSTASIVRKIHAILLLNDPRNTPKEGTIRNILCSEGIGKTGGETKEDFELEIPDIYRHHFKLNT